jgi:hypothetical protein
MFANDTNEVAEVPNIVGSQSVATASASRRLRRPDQQMKTCM